MTHTITVEEAKDSSRWLLFIDGIPIDGFTDHKTTAALPAGRHRMKVELRNGGAEIKVTVSNATAEDAKGWPLVLTVPKTHTGKVFHRYFNT